MRRSAVLALAILGLLASASPAGAHALLAGSAPPSGAILQRAPDAVTLTFTEQPEPTLSVVHVVDATGRVVDGGPLQTVPGHPLVLRVPLARLGNSVYTVTWRTVSRVDGHVTGGTFAFGVGVAPAASSASPTTAPPPSPLAVGARWAFYAGLSGLIGAAWVWTFVLPERALEGHGYLWCAWALAAAGVVAMGVAQAADAGVPLARLLGTALGRELWWRAVPVACAGIAVGARWVGRARRRAPALIVIGAASAAAMLAHVLAGHAAAGTSSWRPAFVADQWAHFLAVGSWLGGLAALLAMLPRAPDDRTADAVRRFSAGAGIAIGVVALTGIVRAVDEVGSWGGLVSTTFGRLVLLKGALLLALAALGAVNRSRTVPAAGRTLRGLRQIGGAELVVAAGVLAATGALTGLAPPALVPLPAAGSIVASGHDYATSVRVRLEAAPGFPGVNDFVARIADYDTGQPVDGAWVALRFASASQPDLGTSSLTLRRAGRGVYRARGANLSLEGTWTITVVLQRATTSVEVPLTLTARSRPQVVRTITAPGQPTLYSIDLEAGRVLDVYLDPGRPGFNEVHATFIDAGGGELPVPRPARMMVARPGQGPRALPVRRFGPGHFIGDARLAGGDWQLEIVAVARDGAVLDARLTLHLR